MNCIGPIAPALDGPMFVPKPLSIELIAASSDHGTPYCCSALTYSGMSSAGIVACAVSLGAAPAPQTPGPPPIETRIAMAIMKMTRPTSSQNWTLRFSGLSSRGVRERGRGGEATATALGQPPTVVAIQRSPAWRWSVANRG